MKLNDNLIFEELKNKNELESYIYNMRNDLGDCYKDFIQPDKT